MSKYFLYFAYGSNLLAQRIHINNPSATRVEIGKLENYRLDFTTYSKRWKGASATIVPTEGTHVWGALWKIDMEHMPHLDDQEGVSHNIYFPLEVTVETLNGDTKKCRVYQQCATPEQIPDNTDIPMDRRPSFVYLNILIRGAKESGLPEYYIEKLKQYPHNGYDGKVDIDLDLHLIE